jgi:hypothetical protein
VRVHADGWVYDGCPHAGPSVVVGQDSVVHVAWYTGAENTSGIFHASSRDGGRTFGEAHRVTDEGHVPTSQVALDADDAGHVWIAWESVGEDGPRIRLGLIQASGVVERMEVDAPRGLLPAIATGGGNLVLTWLDGEAARALVGAVETR